MKPSIKLKNVNVVIPIFTSDSLSFKKHLLGFAPNVQNAHVLKNINLEIQYGDRVGVYGNNGAGKTSLLRSVAGGYYPVNGAISISGSVSSMIDIGLGLDQEASGFDNVRLKLGLTSSKLRNNMKLVQDIINFSELNDVIHLPLRTYSSGMAMRLAFSIATGVRSDILVLDEWLSVGDASFSEKTKNRMDELVEDSSIIIIASHSMDLLRKVCNRLVTMDHGSIISDEKL